MICSDGRDCMRANSRSDLEEEGFLVLPRFYDLAHVVNMTLAREEDEGVETRWITTWYHSSKRKSGR
jgi:hypothetical protein